MNTHIIILLFRLLAMSLQIAALVIRVYKNQPLTFSGNLLNVIILILWISILIDSLTKVKEK